MEEAWDVANVLLDLHEYQRDPSVANAVALGTDLVAAAVPFVPAGAGLIVRGSKTVVQTASRAGKTVQTADDIARGMRALRNRAMKAPPACQYGLQAELARAEEYLAKGELRSVEFVEGRNRYDIVLASEKVVEVKYWREDYARLNVDKVENQLKRYSGAGRDVILEFKKTKTNTISEAYLNELSTELERRGVDMSRVSINLVP